MPMLLKPSGFDIRTRFKASAAGTYNINLKPGTYSVLAVGGGGGALLVAGTYADIGGAGGGSGRAVKTRLVVTSRTDVITLRVGVGGNFQFGNSDGNTPAAVAGSGESSVVQINGSTIAVAVGGDGASQKNEVYNSGGNLIRTHILNGGAGASGGGGGGYVNTIKTGTIGDGGSNGNNGVDAGTNPNIGFGGAGDAHNSSFSSGSYYSNVITSVDPSITHSFVLALPLSYGGVSVQGQVFNSICGGGGGGLGTFANVGTRGSGYGAGGGSGIQTTDHASVGNGVAGFISIVPIDNPDGTEESTTWIDASAAFVKTNETTWTPIQETWVKTAVNLWTKVYPAEQVDVWDETFTGSRTFQSNYTTTRQVAAPTLQKYAARLRLSMNSSTGFRVEVQHYYEPDTANNFTYTPFTNNINILKSGANINDFEWRLVFTTGVNFDVNPFVNWTSFNDTSAGLFPREFYSTTSATQSVDILSGSFTLEVRRISNGEVRSITLNLSTRNELLAFPSGGGPGGGGGCLSLDTLILMEDGTHKMALDVEVGDRVVGGILPTMLDASNPNWRAWTSDVSWKEFEKKIVTVKTVKFDSFNSYFVINNTLTITHSHLILINRKGVWLWSDARYLTIGDILINEDGMPYAIETLEFFEENIDVVDFDVEETDTYFAGGYLVHNAEQIKN